MGQLEAKLGSRILQIGRTVGFVLAGATALFGCSYFEEMPNYQFEKNARELERTTPGVRRIGATKTADLTSPLSWFRPTEASIRLARPDPIMIGRFEIIVLVRGEPQHRPWSGFGGGKELDRMIQLMADTECEDRSISFASPNEDHAAPPLRDVLGQVVVDNEGRIFRVMKNQRKATEEELAAFCDTDWSSELEEIRSSLNSGDR